MLKNRPFLMVVTGAALAILLWLLVLAFQSGTKPVDSATPSAIPGTSNTIPEDYAITPASVQSVNEGDDKIVVTGLGVTGAGVALTDGGIALAESKIDASGDWVMSLATPPLAETTKLDIIMTTPEGQSVRSEQAVFLVKTTDQKMLVLLTEPGAHSRVLQSPFADLPHVGSFELEAIDYDNAGGVIFSGSSGQSGKVLIYANENQVGESRTDRNGRWTLIFGSIMPLGEYNITAEFVPDESTDSLRITLPFARVEPLFESEGSPKLLVQNLEDRIQIGRALYGGGYQYTVIYSSEAIVE